MMRRTSDAAGLLLQRLAQFARARLQVVEQAHVLDRNYRAFRRFALRIEVRDDPFPRQPSKWAGLRQGSRNGQRPQTPSPMVDREIVALAHSRRPPRLLRGDAVFVDLTAHDAGSGSMDVADSFARRGRNDRPRSPMIETVALISPEIASHISWRISGPTVSSAGIINQWSVHSQGRE